MDQFKLLQNLKIRNMFGVQYESLNEDSKGCLAVGKG